MSAKLPAYVLLLALCSVTGVRQAARDELEAVPSEISNAIRDAKSHAKKALEAAEAREKEVNDRKATAEKTAEQKAQAEKEKEAAARDAAAKTKEASDQAKAKAKAAAAALQSNKDWNDAVKREQDAQAALERAVEAENKMSEHVQAEIRKLKKMLADKQQETADATEAHNKAVREAEELRVAYQAAQEHENNEVKALAEANAKVNEANKLASEKAAAAKVAGREAEAAQNALDDAVNELNEAKQVVQQKRDMKKALWELYDRIEEFYDAASKLTKVMRNSEDSCSKKPYECLISDGEGGGRAELQKVLEGYNTMVLAFMKIKELYIEVYSEIAQAGIEIETNAMAQVHLSCDPYKELEQAGDAAAFNAKCGDGLWPALNLNKNRFF